MSIKIGHAYKFTFDTGFTALNGIHKATHAMDYDSLITDEIDLFESLYKPANKSELDLATDLPSLTDKTFYRLVNMADQTVVYVPNHIIVGFPVPDVREYAKVMLTVDLGTFADPVLLTSLVDTMKTVLEGSHGITNDPIVATYDSKWMSESEYEAIVAAREAARTGVTNYYTLSVQQADTIVDKDAKIAHLEELVEQLHNELNP